MTFLGWVTIFGFAVALTVLALPFGRYLAAVYTGGHTVLDRVMGGPERLLYRVMRVDPERGQDWKAYARSLIIFSFAGWLLLYFILRTQGLWSFTGLNPQGFHSAPWKVTFNTTSSFLTNTNWQYYGGETTMSYFSQMAGLTVQNFLSAGAGICVAIALIRGIIGRSGKSLGNFWQDIVRKILWVFGEIVILRPATEDRVMVPAAAGNGRRRKGRRSRTEPGEPATLFARRSESGDPALTVSREA